jgi:hypothetical protein
VVPSCPPPTITSFSPLTGVSGTILTIVGSNLDEVTGVTINNVTTTTGITILNAFNISVVVPYSNTTVAQTNPIILKGIHGDSLNFTLDSFTYNPAQVTPTTPSPIPNAPPNVNTQSQQTGPIVLTAATTYNLLGGADTMKVSINPAAGSWNIIKEFTGWTWKGVRLVTGPNNTFIEEVIASGDYGSQLENFVSVDKQTFNITNTDILTIIKNDIDNDVEFNKINKVYNKISLTSVSQNKFDKFNITNNPNDVIADVYYTFPFTVKII